MAFKRSNFTSLVNNKKEYFGSSYKFSKKANFKVGSDAYVIPLGLETGYYETPCHKLSPHKVNGQLVGFNGSNFTTYIKCNGMSEDGTRTSSLCCELAKLEKTRIPDKEQSANRIISFTTCKIHIPVLILSSSLEDTSRIAYPISNVSITKDLNSEKGLNFAYLDFAASTFMTDVISAYGKKLKEDGVLDYELDEESPEFLEEVRNRLTKTIIKIHGVQKQGFQAAMKEYSFFPFENRAIASKSSAGEYEAIVNYASNNQIVAQINDFLTLFDAEVDNLTQSWTEKDLLEYYNSAIGLPLTTSLEEIPNLIGQGTPQQKVEEVQEAVEVLPAQAAQPIPAKPVAQAAQPIPVVPNQPVILSTPVATVTATTPAPQATNAELDNFMADPFGEKAAQQVQQAATVAASDAALEEYEYDVDGEDDFFEEG